MQDQKPKGRKQRKDDTKSVEAFPWKDKIKHFFHMEDEDIDSFLCFDLRKLALDNHDAFVRLMACYGAVFAAVIVFLLVFHYLGVADHVFAQIIFATLFFGGVAFAVYRGGIDKVIKLTDHKVIVVSLLIFFSLIAFIMFCGVTSGGMFAKAVLVLILAGLGSGGYFVFKYKKLALSVMQIVLCGTVIAGYLFSVQSSFVGLGIRLEADALKRREEIRRRRDAEAMERSMMTSKACSTEEECRKLNVKKSQYYAEHEEEAQDVCEKVVSGEIQGRFEWTVGAKDYKFTSYSVDVLHDMITLMGDKAQLVLPNEGRTKLSYTCKFNVKTRVATASVTKTGG